MWALLDNPNLNIEPYVLPVQNTMLTIAPSTHALSSHLSRRQKTWRSYENISQRKLCSTRLCSISPRTHHSTLLIFILNSKTTHNTRSSQGISGQQETITNSLWGNCGSLCHGSRDCAHSGGAEFKALFRRSIATCSWSR